MPYKFEDDVQINYSRDLVWSWLLGDSGNRVLRLEMSREYLEDHFQAYWTNKTEVTATFRTSRGRYLERAVAAAQQGETTLQILNRN